MFVDLRLANLVAERRREELARAYAKRQSVEQEKPLLVKGPVLSRPLVRRLLFNR